MNALVEMVAEGTFELFCQVLLKKTYKLSFSLEISQIVSKDNRINNFKRYL
jgi:hypothetical protein